MLLLRGLCPGRLAATSTVPWVQGLGFGLKDLGLRIQGLGFWIHIVVWSLGYGSFVVTHFLEFKLYTGAWGNG